MIEIKGQLPRHALMELRNLQDILARTPSDSLQAMHVRAAIEELVRKHGGRLVAPNPPHARARSCSGSTSVWTHPARGETRKPGSHRSAKW
jgi:hypothetical protein